MFSSHHLMSGPQFSSQPKSSSLPFDGKGGPGGAGGAGGGVGAGGVGAGVGAGGVGAGGVGAGGVGPGGVGAGGVGVGAGGTSLQSSFPLHFVAKSALQSPPVPPDG